MGEHHRNPNAIAKAARPPAQPQLSVQLAMQHRLKPHLLVLPPERIRTNADGKQEAQDAKGEWGVVPEGMQAIPDGAQGIEYFDCVVGIVAISQSSLAAIDGRPVGRMRWLQDLYREDAKAFAEALEPPKPQPVPVTA